MAFTVIHGYCCSNFVSCAPKIFFSSPVHGCQSVSVTGVLSSLGATDPPPLDELLPLLPPHPAASATRASASRAQSALHRDLIPFLLACRRLIRRSPSGHGWEPL